MSNTFQDRIGRMLSQCSLWAHIYTCTCNLQDINYTQHRLQINTMQRQANSMWICRNMMTSNMCTNIQKVEIQQMQSAILACFPCWCQQAYARLCWRKNTDRRTRAQHPALFLAIQPLQPTSSHQLLQAEVFDHDSDEPCHVNANCCLVFYTRHDQNEHTAIHAADASTATHNKFIIFTLLTRDTSAESFLIRDKATRMLQVDTFVPVLPATWSLCKT